MHSFVYAACVLLLQSAQARRQWLTVELPDEEFIDQVLDPGAKRLSTAGRSLQNADCETYRSADGSTVRTNCDLGGGHALAAGVIAVITVLSVIAVCCLPLLILACCAAKASRRKRELQMGGRDGDAADPGAYMAQGYPMGPPAPIGTVSPHPAAGGGTPPGKGAIAQPPYGAQGHPYAPQPPPMHAEPVGLAAADGDHGGHMAAASSEAAAAAGAAAAPPQGGPVV